MNQLESTINVNPVTTNPAGNEPNQPEKKSKTLLVLLVAAGFILVLGLLLVVIISQQTQPKAPPQTTRVEPTLSPTPTPTEEQAIKTLDVGEVETDLSSLEKDLEEL